LRIDLSKLLFLLLFSLIIIAKGDFGEKLKVACFIEALPEA
jgi:hypothetical protein